MKFTSISNDFFNLCNFDPELLHKEGRPYLIILRLKYNGHDQDFAIPFRSNMSKYIPKNQYFSLPPRHTTKKNKIHGLHYLKMFPIHKKYLEKFHADNDPYYIKIMKIINRNKKQIIRDAQSYLNDYQNGKVLDYSTQIHNIYLTINTPIETLHQVAIDKPEE